MLVQPFRLMRAFHPQAQGVLSFGLSWLMVISLGDAALVISTLYN